MSTWSVPTVAQQIFPHPNLPTNVTIIGIWILAVSRHDMPVYQPVFAGGGRINITDFSRRTCVQINTRMCSAHHCPPSLHPAAATHTLRCLHDERWRFLHTFNLQVAPTILSLLGLDPSHLQVVKAAPGSPTTQVLKK